MITNASELYGKRGGLLINSAAVYMGPSRINGAPLVVIVTGLKSSKNEKTGAMVQSYILRADINPRQAIKEGKDSAICGGCVHRGGKGRARSCYVRVEQAPLSLWRAWKRGNMPTISLDVLSELTAGRMVRLGSYGDPAAVPLKLWRAYTARAKGWTGYTHQARSEKLRDVLELCQVSADSIDDARAARSAGVGSFRVLAEGEEPAPFETVCPASKEAGKVATCDTCGLCSGMTGASVAIRAHGARGAHYVPSNRRGLVLPVINPARAVANA